MGSIIEKTLLEITKGEDAMSDYILTYSKIKFYPMNPIIDDINIKDIAHALSLMTRANGHFKYFYSVAQHSINCYREAKARGYSKRIQLGCLLHDGSECYISDLTRPVKQNLDKYIEMEEKIQGMIYQKFGLGDLSKEEKERIKDIDDALLYYEFKSLMGERIFDEKPYIARGHDFSLRGFKTVENEFISIYNLLTTDQRGFCSVGIDGCKKGWVVVSITDDDFEIEIIDSIETICSNYGDRDSIIVDMPIGLPENTEDMRPEGEARKILKSRACCVFNTPCRQAVYEKDYHRANEINKKNLGKGLSKQSFAICNKIKEIDEFLEKTPEYKNKIVESHPEVCFAILNFNGDSPEPIYENKKTKEGMDKRLELLSKYYSKTEDIKAYIHSDPTLYSIRDDVVDALCLAVIGMLGIKNGFSAIPEKPMEDNKGILMQMVYPNFREK